jgi:hypothetical protein
MAVALDRNDGVDQPVDHQTMRAHRARDRIDQKGHVLIDHGDAHEALTRRARHGFDVDGALRAFRRAAEVSRKRAAAASASALISGSPGSWASCSLTSSLGASRATSASGRGRGLGLGSAGRTCVSLSR